MRTRKFKPMPILETDNQFQVRLKRLMNLSKESAPILASHIGVTDQSVRNWASKGNIPRIETIQAIAKHYHVQTGYLIGETSNPLRRWD